MSRTEVFRHLLLVGMVAILCCPRAAPQDDDDIEAIDKRIFQEIREHNQVMENLEYLSDSIGPRLTGSDQLQKAVNWVSDLAHRYGLENVHVEGWKVAHSWQRGSARARIFQPVLRISRLVPGTAGEVRGKVVYVSATKHERTSGISWRGGSCHFPATCRPHLASIFFPRFGERSDSTARTSIRPQQSLTGSTV
jgi:hypothetical protein